MRRPAPIHERYEVVPLAARHDRRSFTCGDEALDRYLRDQAGQEARRHASSVLVAEERATDAVRGFYTLSMASVLLDHLPKEVARRMPRYPTLPAVRLGRLAVHVEARGQGLGSHLLMNALARSLDSEIAWVACLVEAKDEQSRAFYLPFGFRFFADDPDHLYLMRKTIAPLFR